MIERLTLEVPDLAASRAFFDLLGYKSFATSCVSAQLCEALGDVSLVAAPSARILLRNNPMQALDLVETVNVQQAGFQTPGFAALELLVGGLDQLAVTVTKSNVAMLGAPSPLSFSEHIRAMQLLGPNNELVYCTEVSGPIPGFTLPVLDHKAGECFVVITAVSDIEESLQFYSSLFGNEPPDVMQSRVVAMSHMQGLNSEAVYDIAALSMSARHYLELDQWLPVPTEKSIDLGLKSSARILCVSLTHESRHQIGDHAEREWQEQNGTWHCLVRGPDGELFEFVKMR